MKRHLRRTTSRSWLATIIGARQGSVHRVPLTTRRRVAWPAAPFLLPVQPEMGRPCRVYVHRMPTAHATACTALHTAQHVHLHVHVRVCVHAHVRTCRYNLMEHVGAVSTLRDEPHPESLPRCNDFLGASAPFQPTHCLECRRRTLYACLGLPFGSEGELICRREPRLQCPKPPTSPPFATRRARPLPRGMFPPRPLPGG